MPEVYKPGSRVFSDVCATEMIVVRASVEAVDITIGGVPTVTLAADRTGEGLPAAGHDGGSVMGKRYVDSGDSIEVLCTKPGAGSVAVNGEVLVLKDAAPLPASD
jgi:hypothetical protein